MEMNIKKITAPFQKVFGRKEKSEKKGSGKEFIAKLSKGLMLPIAMLPIAGLFLGIGAAIVTASQKAGNDGLEIFGNFLKVPGDVIFGALPVLFAIAIAIAFTKDAGPAALSAFVGFLVFSGLQSALITPVLDGNKEIIGYDLLFYTNGALGEYSDGFGLPKSLFGTVIGINQLQSSVFGGFIVGFTVAFLYNKFKNIQLPQIIGFFSGIRFIPIITFLAFFPITILFLMIWPLIGILFNIIGGGLGSNMFGFNSFIFGYIERALVPFGLHHAFYTPLWYSSVGGTLDLTDKAYIAGQIVTTAGSVNNAGGLTWGQMFEALGALPDGVSATSSIAGDQVIWAALNGIVGKNVTLGNGTSGIVQFSDFTTSVYSQYNSIYKSAGVNAGQYMQGKYSFMMFGLPAAAAAMIMAAPKENRKMSASIIGSAGLTSFLTGITEPIEFTFLFLAPWLFWGVHAFFCALSFGLMNWIGLIIPEVAPHIGMTFSGGAIDWVIYGAIQIPGGSNAWWALVFGIAYVPIYYFLFYFLIKKFDISTPGRGSNTRLFTKADFNNRGNSSKSENRNMALNIIQAYGGIDNIKNVDACITKLRIQVADQSIVNESKLTNELGAMGVIKPSKQSVYSIYGARADLYKNEINDILKEIEHDPSLKTSLFENIKSVENSSTNNSFEKSTEKVVVYAPVDCEVVPLENVPDATFSDGIMGEGVAIISKGKEFSSIIKSGEMELAFDTGHAYSFKTKEGTQILMHIGIDSINLKTKDGKDAKVFKPFVKTGDKLNSKTKIVEVNNSKLKELAKSNITPIIVLNESIKGRTISILAKGKTVKKGEPLFEIK